MKFTYAAFDRDCRKKKGVITALSIEKAADILKEKGLFVMSLMQMPMECQVCKMEITVRDQEVFPCPLDARGACHTRQANERNPNGNA